MKTLNRMIRIALVAALLGGAFVALVPTSSAQLEPACGPVAKPSLNIKNPTQVGGATPIKPVSGQGQVSFDVEYIATQGYSLTPVIVTVDVKAKDTAWTSISWSPQTFAVELPSTPGQEGIKDTVKVTVDFAFSQAAPAFQKTGLDIDVSATSGTCVEAPDGQSGQSPQLIVGFYERYQVRFDKAIHKTGQNAQISIPMVIQNFGNGDIQLKFALAENSAKRLSTALPPPIVVRSLAAGGETDTANVPIDVQTPFKNGYENRRDTFVLNVNGYAADDIDDTLEPVQLTAVIQTQGVYVPGFEAVTMLGAVIGAALLARRRV